MKTTIEWTSTYLQSPVICPTCNGTGEAIRKKILIMCPDCEGSRQVLKLSGYTFNGWWGCQKITRGCKFCYAETFSNRFNQPTLWGPNAPRKFFGDKHWNEPLKWQAESKRTGIKRKVFAFSMADWAEDRRDLDIHRARLFRLIEQCPDLIWLLLTKRIEVAHTMVPEGWLTQLPANVWLGATIEEPDVVKPRLDALLKFSGTTFLSCEPLVREIDITPGLYTLEEDSIVEYKRSACSNKNKLSWVIVGGESGSPQPMHPGWVLTIQKDCEIAGVPFFFKQWGDWMPTNDTNVVVHRVTGEVLPIAQADERCHGMKRVGKQVAGRLLFGKEYNQMPV